ncbi:MAG: Ig-like domain-containing protein [Myxococcota bacterium]|nr:Ig-like domain-containing protein [Myxococcota bacterium]
MRAALVGAVRAIALTAVALTGVAHAERPQPTTIRVPPRLVPHAEPTSRLVYLNRCPAAGCIVNQGNDDDSRTNTSSISQGTSTLSGFRQSDAVWAATLACVRATYAPFNIGITDINPGNVPHYEHMVGGFPSELRNDISNAGGVAPFACEEIPNAISFTFDVYGPDADSLCWTASQEIAHAFGLEHELDNRDPMTYLSGPLPKRFQAVDAQCGEGTPRPCECTGRPTQNSYEMILAMFGMGAPTPPTVRIKSPTNGKTVQPRFVTRIDATDDTAIDRVELWVDGAKLAETQQPPYVIVAPDTIAEGAHTLEVKAFDVQGTSASATLDIVMGPPCTASKGCTGDDVCVMGVCLAGPNAPGGLGAICQGPTECISRQCLADRSGAMHCVEACDLSPGSCPSDFACVETTPDAGVCWPSESGGCCGAGGSPSGPALLGLGVLALVIRRRRRRR